MKNETLDKIAETYKKSILQSQPIGTVVKIKKERSKRTLVIRIPGKPKPYKLSVSVDTKPE